MKVEFMNSPDQEEIIILENGNVRVFKETDALFLNIYELFSKNYPQAFTVLEQLYESKFSRLTRFISCNFSLVDNVLDIENEIINLEFVQCPIRRECKEKNVVCSPKRYTKLTTRQIEIANLVAKGFTAKEIGVALNVSVHTAEKHIKNIQSALGLRNKAEITKYALNFLQ